MSVFKRQDSDNWWYKFVWRGKEIRESTKQTNKRVAEQIEAARRTALAKGEVGIKDRKQIADLKDFATLDFLPFVKSTFAEKKNTATYYESGVRALLSFDRLANLPLDAITGEGIAAYVAMRQAAGLKTSSINRELQVLRRMFHLASEWGKTDKALAKVRMLAGEAHRERVLSPAQESAYLQAAGIFGQSLQEAYQNALTGIRATKRGEIPIKPTDPFRLRDAALILLDCALRPEECFRLRWESVSENSIEIRYGKTDNARRRIPVSDRVATVLDWRRRTATPNVFVFPAPTRSGHIEPSSLRKPHTRVCKDACIDAFELYTFRHTCLTRWACSGMDPWTLAYLAGHRDMSITKRYVHPQTESIREALGKARPTIDVSTGYVFGYSAENKSSEKLQ